MTAIESGDRAGWLSLFSEDAIVQDPVGVSALDPTGEGHRGKDAIAAFYDNTIAPNKIEFSIDRSYAAGNECANIGTITTTLPSGDKALTRGAFVYCVDDEAKIISLRAFWEFDQLEFVAAK